MITVQAPHDPRSHTRFDAGDVEPRAQRVEQRDARLDLELVRAAVDVELDRHGAGTKARAVPCASAASAGPTTPAATPPAPTVLRNVRRLKPGSSFLFEGMQGPFSVLRAVDYFTTGVHDEGSSRAGSHDVGFTQRVTPGVRPEAAFVDARRSWTMGTSRPFGARRS